MKFAVTMSETGGARFVEAASHREALEMVDPLMSYAGGEWPEYDDAGVFLRRGAEFERDPMHEEFMRRHGSITSADCPAWDEEAGPVMALSSEKAMQSVLVYPVLMFPSELPDEERLPGWRGGLSDELFPDYGKFTRSEGGFFMVVLLEESMERLRIPDGGFRYRWAVIEHGVDVAQGRGCRSALEAMEAASAALGRCRSERRGQ